MSAHRQAEALREGHIGLASSAERVRALGGSFELHSEPGRGTAVKIALPLDACEVTGTATGGPPDGVKRLMGADA
jgi:signal transduction histidine kinase